MKIVDDEGGDISPISPDKLLDFQRTMTEALNANGMSECPLV